MEAGRRFEGSDFSSSSTNGSTADTVATSLASDSPSVVKNGTFAGTLQKNGKALAGEILDRPKVEAQKHGVKFRVEYRYFDGAMAHEKEGADESKLLDGHGQLLDALPPLTITTVYTSSTTKDQSRKKKGSKTDSKEDVKSKVEKGDDKEVSEEKEADFRFEDFAANRTSEKYMTIHSKKLLNALRSVISYYPGYSLLGDEFRVFEPYRILCHHRKELCAYKDNQPPWHDEAYRTECNEHIDVLLDFLDARFGKALQDEEDRWARPTPVCTFEYLWLLFKPGEICYYTFEDETNPYITQEVMRSGGIVRNKAIKYAIETWNINYDGYQMGRSQKWVWLTPFDGEKEIKSLKYYPAVYRNETQETMEMNGGITFYQRLVARGRKFWGLATKPACYQEYNGDSAGYPSKKIQGRVVVHPRAYFDRYDFEHSDRGSNDTQPTIMNNGYDSDDDQTAVEANAAGCQCRACADNPVERRLNRFEGYHGLYPNEDQPPEDEMFFFLCDRKAFGFVLKSRTWETFKVENLADVREQESAFAQLVLPEDVKYTLQAISCSYVKAQGISLVRNTDIVQGKGEGKIFLLHGPPGTGKTLSAEVVAELTNRPLLSLTCGDLGTTAEEVELRLSRYMSLGETWEAVVLLDEADIYLEARAINEVKRNSLVSVFLRALEYYKGLLFLTTNRVNTFDEAFKSRIHVALEYKRLNDIDRRKIWKNNMNNMASERIIITDTARRYACFDEDVLSLEWNGREIRNALQTALSLAEFEAQAKGKDTVVIKSAHLERIVALSASFQRYIASMHRNKPDAYVAKKKQLRNDYYEEGPPRTSDRNTMGRSKFMMPDEDEEPVSVKAKTRSVKKTEHDDMQEDEQPKRNSSRGHVKKSSRPISEDEEEPPRTRSRQPKQGTRQIATIEEEESEYEAPMPKKSGRRAPRSLEEEPDDNEIVKPTATARRPTKHASRYEEFEDGEPFKPTAQSRKVTKALPIYEDEQDEDEVSPRALKPTRRATNVSRGYEREAQSRSPARAKKEIARKPKRIVSESEEE